MGRLRLAPPSNIIPMSWLSFTFIDFLDIVIFGTVLYFVYNSLRKSGSSNLLLGIIALVMLWVIATVLLNMKVMGRVMSAVMNAGLLALVIIFQDDIRRFLNALGSGGNRWLSISRLFRARNKKEELQEEASYIAMITFACISMARKKTGALIVLEQRISLLPYMHTGEIINADVNSRLIENIFFKNSPLHDGALIISDHKLMAAGCILPVAQGQELPKEMGLRHRSGLGMSQQSDAKVIIVSEERGEISLAYRGEMIADADVDQIQLFLSSSFRDMSDVGEIINIRE